VTGRVGYTWGPGLVYVKGGYAYSDNNETVTLGASGIPFATSGDHRNGYTVGAGSNTCSPRTWSAVAEYPVLQFRRQPIHLAGGAGSVRQVHHRRSRGEGRRELPLQLGQPGRRPRY